MKLSRKSIERLLDLAAKGLSGLEQDGLTHLSDDHRFLIRSRAALLPEERKPVKPRNKGARGERDAILYLKDQGFSWDMKRGLQSRGGGAEQADVMNAGPFHVEVKRVEKLNIHAALQQACDDAAEGKIPIVLHRRNNEKWKVTLRADDFFEIFRESSYAGDAARKCESSLPDCGPVVTSDVEGVPLCQRCADELAKDPSCHSSNCPCFMCSGDESTAVPTEGESN